MSKYLQKIQNQMAELHSDKNFENPKESLVAFNLPNGEHFVRWNRFFLKCQVFYALHDKLQVEIDDRFQLNVN